jgi:hypothetical protein
MRKIIFFLIIVSILSCERTSKVKTNEKIIVYGDSVSSINQPDKPIEELKDLAINQGDTNAYFELYIAYLDYSHGEFLQIAEEMALKQSYTRAYYDAYTQLLKKPFLDDNKNSFYRLDEKTKSKALKYLKIAAKRNYSPAIDDLRKLNSKTEIIKDTIDYYIIKTKKTTTP